MYYIYRYRRMNIDTSFMVKFAQTIKHRMESAHFDSIKQIIIYHHVAIMSSLLSDLRGSCKRISQLRAS